MDIQALSQANIDASLKEITAKAQTLSIKDADSRRELLDAAQALCRELETPMESIYRLIIIQVRECDTFGSWSLPFADRCFTAIAVHVCAHCHQRWPFRSHG